MPAPEHSRCCPYSSGCGPKKEPQHSCHPIAPPKSTQCCLKTQRFRTNSAARHGTSTINTNNDDDDDDHHHHHQHQHHQQQRQRTRWMSTSTTSVSWRSAEGVSAGNSAKSKLCRFARSASASGMSASWSPCLALTCPRAQRNTKTDRQTDARTNEQSATSRRAAPRAARSKNQTRCNAIMVDKRGREEKHEHKRNSEAKEGAWERRDENRSRGTRAGRVK